MADTRLRSVTVNLTCGQPESRLFNVQWPVGGRAVDESDIRRVVNEGRARASVDGREVIHALPLTFTVDQTDGVSDPRGLFCEELTARLHIVDAVSTSLRSLSACIAHCDLDIAELVSAPMAAGLATLVADERELGATVIDMGGGTTGMAVFGEGQLLHTAQLPVGGVHVTNDLARMLSTPVAHAERLKTLYGNVAVLPGRRARDAAGAAGRRGRASDRQGAAQHGGEHHPPAPGRDLRNGEGTTRRFRPHPRRRHARRADRWRVSTRRRARTGRPHPRTSRFVSAVRPCCAACPTRRRVPPSRPPRGCWHGRQARDARCTTSTSKQSARRGWSAASSIF